ncbi:hypothetical protein RvY_19601, partial [Ramazzottius varieornatus]
IRAIFNVIPDTENPLLIAVTKVFQSALYLLSANWIEPTREPQRYAPVRTRLHPCRWLPC